MSHIVMSGATGVIGRLAVPRLLEAGHRVTALGRDPTKLRRLESLGAPTLRLDLFDAPAVRRALAALDADVLVNLATAVPKPGPGIILPWSWSEMARVRRDVSRHLADAALAAGGVARFVQESFAPIYADGGDGWIDESAPVRPAWYNRSALDAEGAAARFTGGGRTGVVLRFGMFYGSEDASTETLLDSVRRGWWPFVGRREAYMAWIAHEDAAAAVVAAVDLPAGIYNVVDDEPMRRGELARGIAHALQVRPPRFPPSWATWLNGTLGSTMARSLRVSNRKLRERGTWTPRFRSALAGLEAVVARGAATASSRHDVAARVRPH